MSLCFRVTPIVLEKPAKAGLGGPAGRALTVRVPLGSLQFHRGRGVRCTICGIHGMEGTVTKARKLLLIAIA